MRPHLRVHATAGMVHDLRQYCPPELRLGDIDYKEPGLVEAEMRALGSRFCFCCGRSVGTGFALGQDQRTRWNPPLHDGSGR